MAITTYSELTTAIATWLKRSDLTSEIVDFVTLGEAHLNRKLRLLQQETTASVTLSSGASTASLPTGFLEPISLVYTSDGVPLVQQGFDDLADLSQGASSGRPHYYGIGSTFVFERTADQAYTLTSRHFQKWDIATDTTNWLLTNAPDAYLFSALIQAKAFVKKTEDVMVWSQGLQATIQELNTLDNRSRKQATTRVDSGMTGRRSFNINRGY